MGRWKWMARASSRARPDAPPLTEAKRDIVATKRKPLDPCRRAAEILSDVISVKTHDTRAGFLTASVISLQKFDARFQSRLQRVTLLRAVVAYLSDH
ncbi:hypothetical protein [Paraburkholderia sp. BL25I1N1]|uniref:hypothetical protein n=1 Tax=Paraburkholderia sp. BL25I1N1 TaxID=1938804 RepID=UPI0011B2046B|nr:hypothetical protein [Paraburkholderia sp. BL25I1N1]